MSISKIGRKHNKKLKDDKNKEISYDEFERDILLEKIKSKDQQIYDLLSKIKSQEAKIEIINKEINDKDLNIYTLEQNYKGQLEEIKTTLGFKGDVDLLLDKKENSYEYEFEQRMKYIFKDNIQKDEKINKLNNEIKLLERENEQLNIFIEIKKNNETMLEMLKSIEESKNIKKADIKSKNDEEMMVNNLMKKNKYLKKRLYEMKCSIGKVNNIMNSIPCSIKRISINNNNDEKNNNVEMKNEEKKKMLEKIKEKDKKENEILLNKYLSIIEQNKKDIIKGNEYLNNIDNIYNEEMKKYKEELFQLFKLIQRLVFLYYKSFKKKYSLLLRKEDFDKLLEKEFINFNLLTFPLLFKFIERKQYSNRNERNSKNESKVKTKFINSNNVEEDDNKKIELLNYLNDKENKIDYSSEEFLNEKKSLLSNIDIKREDHLNNLSKEELMEYALTFNSFIIDYEYLINKYIDLKNKNIFDKFLEIPKKTKKSINKKLIEINKRIKELVQKQNHINIVMEVTSNSIQKIKNENLKLSQKIKMISSIDKKIKVPQLNFNTNNFSINIFKKPLSNRNSMKNNLNIKKDIHALLTERGHIKDNFKTFKIKIK